MPRPRVVIALALAAMLSFLVGLSVGAHAPRRMGDGRLCLPAEPTPEDSSDG